MTADEIEHLADRYVAQCRSESYRCVCVVCVKRAIDDAYARGVRDAAHLADDLARDAQSMGMPGNGRGERNTAKAIRALLDRKEADSEPTT